MKNRFKRFIQFGRVADKSKREIVSEKIYQTLMSNDYTSEKKLGIELDIFSDSLVKILSNKTMKELSSKDGELAEKITEEILDFLEDTNKTISKSESPHETEYKLLSNFSSTSENTFKQDWKQFKEFIKATYSKTEINLSFYEKEFEATLNQNKGEKEKTKFENVKEHFIEKWQELYLTKQSNWELNLIDEQRKIFCDELYKRIEELKKLQQVLEPFTSEVGRLWDMSKGKWQKTNFDVLKKYAELLKNDNSLKELAEMLGRMRQSEIEFEEELFTNIVIKPEWKVEQASKADLIGVTESDDISSLLPSEVVLLADQSLQTIFFKKYSEKKLQTFEYQAKVLSYEEKEFLDKRNKEKEDKKGPFIICVDTSGSMHGTPETVAKTLCFAILKIAISEKRKCYLISFSTGIETLELTDIKNSLDKLLQFLSMSFNGGTDASPAMNEALRMLTTNDYKKADVLMISDFVMPSFEHHIQEQIAKAKESNTKFHSLVIGNSRNNNTIKEFDNNWVYDGSNSRGVITLVNNIRKI